MSVIYVKVPVRDGISEIVLFHPIAFFSSKIIFGFFWDVDISRIADGVLGFFYVELIGSLRSWRVQGYYLTGRS